MPNGKTQPDPVATGHGSAQALPKNSGASKPKPGDAVRKATKKAIASLGETAHQPAAMAASPVGGDSPAGLELVQVAQGVIGGLECLVVDGRALHEVLGAKRDFATWLKSKLDEYGFIEKVDFEIFPQTGENSKVGRPTQDYSLSLDMAKELAMVERTPQGRAARRYFIACEQRLMQAGIPAPALAKPTHGPVGHEGGDMLDYFGPEDVHETAMIHNAMYTRTWLLAMREANNVLLLGRDAGIAEGFACVYQQRMLSQLVKSLESINFAERFKDNYIADTTAYINSWMPAPN